MSERRQKTWRGECRGKSGLSSGGRQGARNRGLNRAVPGVSSAWGSRGGRGKQQSGKLAWQ